MDFSRECHKNVVLFHTWLRVDCKNFLESVLKVNSQLSGLPQLVIHVKGIFCMTTLVKRGPKSLLKLLLYIGGNIDAHLLTFLLFF